MAGQATSEFMKWCLFGSKESVSVKSIQMIRNELKNKELVKFFLEQICNDLYQCISRPVERFDNETVSQIYQEKVKWDDIQWRFHFRKYSALSESKSSICVETDKYLSFVSNIKGNNIQEVEWNGFIKNAFMQREKCLIQSANQGQNPIVTEWDDFLTSIPRFRNSMVELKTDMVNFEMRPILTFGVSIKSKTQESLVLASLILYAFEFLNVNKTIGELIESFLDSVLIDDIRSHLK